MNIDEIQKEIKKLSAADRKRLLEHLLLSSDAPSSEVHSSLTVSKEGDHLKIEGGEISILDWHEEFRTNPKIIIRHKDGNEEHINIVAKLKESSLAIGHPAILLALYRWQEIIRYHRSFRRSEYLKPSNYEDFAKVAEDHIKRVMVALLNGAKKRALSAKAALFMMQEGWGMFPEYQALHWVWEQLGDPEIKNKQSVQATLEALEKRLNRFRKVKAAELDTGEAEAIKDNRPLSMATMPIILHFLECEAKHLLAKRPSWRVMQSAFDQWRFSLDAETIGKYRRERKAEMKNKKVDRRFIRPDLFAEFFVHELLPFMSALDTGAENAPG